MVAVQLLPRDQWVAPSSVVLQDEGTAKDDNAEEEDEEKEVSFGILIDCLYLQLEESVCCFSFYNKNKIQQGVLWDSI